jgi:hypothetical protein
MTCLVPALALVLLFRNPNTCTVLTLQVLRYGNRSGNEQDIEPDGITISK